MGLYTTGEKTTTFSERSSFVMTITMTENITLSKEFKESNNVFKVATKI